jgi:hypothetical protein
MAEKGHEIYIFRFIFKITCIRRIRLMGTTKYIVEKDRYTVWSKADFYYNYAVK